MCAMSRHRHHVRTTICNILYGVSAMSRHRHHMRTNKWRNVGHDGTRPKSATNEPKSVNHNSSANNEPHSVNKVSSRTNASAKQPKTNEPKSVSQSQFKRVPRLQPPRIRPPVCGTKQMRIGILDTYYVCIYIYIYMITCIHI